MASVQSVTMLTHAMINIHFFLAVLGVVRAMTERAHLPNLR